MIAVDLGSNTIRFIEFDGKEWGNDFEKIVRTAEGLEATGRVSDEACRRIINAILEAHQHFDFKAHQIVGVTTAAIRMASNADEVLALIEKETGFHFEIIEGIREAALTLLAVQYRLNVLEINHPAFVLVDIGGGSTEVTFVEGFHRRSMSLNSGILTMSEKVLKEQIPLNGLLKEFERSISDFIGNMTDSVLVMTSGTPTTIAAYLMGMDYDSYVPQKINGTLLNQEKCIQAYNELMAMDEHERSRYVGVGREGLISTGILMVISLFHALKCTHGIVIDDGLREGVALNYFFKDQLPDLT